jgi:hypothetical protein
MKNGSSFSLSLRDGGRHSAASSGFSLPRIYCCSAERRWSRMATGADALWPAIIER